MNISHDALLRKSIQSHMSGDLLKMLQKILSSEK